MNWKEKTLMEILNKLKTLRFTPINYVVKTKNNSEINKTEIYDILKVITTFLVVFAHSSRMYTNDGVVHPHNASHFLALTTQFFYSFHMPLFMAISGMVYGFCIIDRGKYKNTATFIKNKALRLLIPYLFFGIIIVAPVMCFCNFTTDNYIRYCIDGIILAKNSRHLWFLLTLFEIFTISMMLRPLFVRKSGVVNSLILILSFLASFFSYKLPNILSIQNVFYYYFFFFIGYLFNLYFIRIEYFFEKNYSIYVIFFCLLISKFIIPGRAHQYSQAISMSLCVVYIIVRIPYSKIVRSSLYSLLNKNGFGIYLFHPMIIYLMYFFMGEFDIQPFVLCLGVFSVAYLLSIFLTEMFRKAGLSIFIGE